MTIPKEDERTPGRDDDETLVRRWFEWAKTARKGGPIVVDRSILLRGIGVLENAYTSTDALRSALAELCGEATFLLDRLSEVDFTDLEYTVRDFDGHVEPSMSRLRGFIRGIETRAALSASPAPSSEGLRTALEKIKGGSFPGATNLAIEGNWKGIVEQLQSIARTALAGVTAPSEVDAK